MSEFSVRVVRIQGFGKHPQADNLSITQVLGSPVIFRTGDFQKGDLAVYVPVEAIVPTSVPGTEFLGEHRRIKAKKLRGIYSEGLLLPYSGLLCPGEVGPDTKDEHLDWPPGTDVATVLGITKHVEEIPVHLRGQALQCPYQDVPVYDIEPYSRHKHLLMEGERVVITEKLHGTNFRAVLVPYADLPEEERDGTGFETDDIHLPRIPHTGTLYIGSRNHFLNFDEKNLYWKTAIEYNLGERLPPGLVFYGEVYVSVQDLKYDHAPGCASLCIFDVWDTKYRRWLDFDDMEALCEFHGLDVVPVLYDGPYSEAVVAEHTSGTSAIADHMREGCVIKPAYERFENHFGRLILKSVSEEYKLRRGGTELQ